MQGLAALAALARAVPSDAKGLLHVNCPHKFCSFSDEVASQGQARWQCFSEASPLRPSHAGVQRASHAARRLLEVEVHRVLEVA